MCPDFRTIVDIVRNSIVAFDVSSAAIPIRPMSASRRALVTMGRTTTHHRDHDRPEADPSTRDGRQLRLTTVMRRTGVYPNESRNPTARLPPMTNWPRRSPCRRGGIGPRDTLSLTPLTTPARARGDIVADASTGSLPLPDGGAAEP